MIQIEHLTKKYGEHLAVDDLNISVEPGKIYGFLGPNGAGKSTTMNIITGYLAATEGSVKINGFDIFNEPEEVKKCIGYLPELPPLYMDMTAREYLYFVADLKKVDKRMKKHMIEEIMVETGIVEVADRLIKHLSKGYKQRVGIAQALVGYPPVLILDEPTVGLDPNQIIEVRELIKKLGQQHTIILSSHILSEVSAVCDFVWIINKGKLVAADTPENLADNIDRSIYFELTLKGSLENIQELIENQSLIASYEVNEVDEKEVKITVKINEDKDDLEETLFYLFADNRIPILSSVRKANSLEDVFLAFTGDEEDEEEE